MNFFFFFINYPINVSNFAFLSLQFYFILVCEFFFFGYWKFRSVSLLCFCCCCCCYCCCFRCWLLCLLYIFWNEEIWGNWSKIPQRSVGGGLDLLVFLSLVKHLYFWREVKGENPANRGSRERRNEYLIPLRMNSCSLSWASHCSSAWDFQPK